VARSTGFICAVGTGGTLAGIGMALKKRNRDVKIGIADPMGAALYSYYTTGVLKSEGSSITEGIGHPQPRRRPDRFCLPDPTRRRWR
jgi:cysteine synthase